jgi:hypothetical protein
METGKIRSWEDKKKILPKSTIFYLHLENLFLIPLLPNFLNSQPPSFSQLLSFPSSSLPSFQLHLSPKKSKPVERALRLGSDRFQF